MTSFAPGDVPALDWKQSVIEYLKRSLAKGNLKTFKEDLEHKTRRLPYSQEDYEIQEIKPPRDGIAYSCGYDKYVPISRGLPSVDGGFVHIERYWDKDGNCIGFSFKGQRFMLQANEYKIPENSELSKFLDWHPGAHVEEMENKFCVTYVGIMPCDIPVKKQAFFDKNGNSIDNSQSYVIKKPAIDKTEGQQDDIQQNHWNLEVIAFLKQFLPKQNLETFKKDLEWMNKMSPNKHYEIQEIKPPRDGIAYSCTYDKHTMISKPPMKSSYAHIEQYWDKDGKCIGFSFEGQQFMFSLQNNDNQMGIPRVEFPNVGRNSIGITEKPQVEHDKPIVSVTLRVMVGNNTEEVVFPGDSDIVKKINELSKTFSIISIHKTAKGYAIITTNTTGLFAGREDGIYDFDINGQYVHSARVKGMHKSTEFQSGQDKVKTKSKVKQASVIKTVDNDR